MKRNVVLVMLALLLFAAPGALAKSTLVIDPLELLGRSIAVELETQLNALDNQMTLAIPITLQNGAIGVGAGVRFYVDGVPHDGFYFGGYAGLFGLKRTDEGTTVLRNPLGLAGVAGYKWHLDGHLVADVGASIGLVAPARSDIRLGIGLSF